MHQRFYWTESEYVTQSNSSIYNNTTWRKTNALQQ